MERTVVAAFGETIIHFDRMEIRRSEQILPATPLEFRLLKFFIENPENTFSRDELIRAVWRPRRRLSARTVDNSILHLRQKLEHDPSRPLYFRTVHGVGYRFVPFGGLLREFSDQRFDVVRDQNGPGGAANTVFSIVNGKVMVRSELPGLDWNVPPVGPHRPGVVSESAQTAFGATRVAYFNQSLRKKADCHGTFGKFENRRVSGAISGNSRELIFPSVLLELWSIRSEAHEKKPATVDFLLGRRRLGTERERQADLGESFESRA